MNPHHRNAPIFPERTVRLSRAIERTVGLFVRRTAETRAAEPGTALIVEPFGLGDCVFVNGMIGAMRRSWPKARVHVLCRPEWSWLFEAWPDTHVHGVHVPWTTGARGGLRAWGQLASTIRELRRAECEIGLDPRGDVRSQGILLAAGCRKRVGYTRYAGSNIVLDGRLLTDIVPYYHEHRLLQNLRLLARAGIPNPEPDYRFPDVLNPTDRFALTIHPGAGWRYKQWRAERWASLVDTLAERVPGPIQLLAHSSEQSIVDAISHRVHAAVVVTLTRDLPGLARALKATDTFIGLDSGALHLAAAMGISSVGLYGPGIVSLFHPIGPKASMVTRHEQFDCAPCLLQTCIHPDANCMDAISVEDVVRAFVARQASSCPSADAHV